MSREEIFNYTAPTMDIYRSLEVEIFRKLVKYLKRDGDFQDVNAWYLETANQFGMLNDEVIDLLEAYSGVSSEVIRRSVDSAGHLAIKDVNDALSPYLGIRESNIETENLLKAYRNQTFRSINNHVNQTLISTNYGSGMLARMYNDIIDKTTANFIAGNLTFHEALERTIIEWVDRGIQTTFIDKGGNIWSLERYIDIVLRSTLNRTYNNLRSARMDEYGVYTVLMGTVPDAAERCARCQGKVLDMRPTGQNSSGFISIFEFRYGEPDGTQGIGCRHPLWPHIPGVSINNQVQYDIEDSIEKSKVRNRQRQLERRIRATKKRIMVLEDLESLGLDRQKQLLRSQQKEIRDLLSDASWLRRQPGNEKVYTPLPLLMKEYLARPRGHFGEEAYHEFWGDPLTNRN